MSAVLDFGEYICEKLSQSYGGMEHIDIGEDAVLKKKGMVFQTDSYNVPGLGHFCIVRMKAMRGLMRMETAVLSITEKDAPLLNVDRLAVFGRTTQMAEIYDVQLAPYPEELLEPFYRLKDKDNDLKEYVSAGHWFDKIRYGCSYGKTGRRKDGRMETTVKGYIETFLSQAGSLPGCDSVRKREKILQYAEKLFSQGGPAVNQVKKLFGEETAERLILKHMYGARP